MNYEKHPLNTYETTFAEIKKEEKQLKENKI